MSAQPAPVPGEPASTRAGGARLVMDAGCVALLALAVRLVHAAFLARTPFFAGPIIDAYTYRKLAEQIAERGDFGAAFYQPPLYPAFLALLLRCGLGSPWAIACVQASLGAGTALLFWALGRALAAEPAHARAVGLASGVGAALYGPFVLFDLELLPPVLVGLLLALALWLALRPARAGVVDAALGLALGLALVGFTLCALLAPGVLAVRALQLNGARARTLALGVALLAAALPVALTARHNAAHGGPGVLISYNGGINLWLGNNPRWRETWRARPGASFEPELERPDREGVTRPAERSAYFVRLVLRDALADPGAAFARTAEKLYYVFHGREIRRNQEIATLRAASPPLRALIWEAGLCFPFGLVAPLALGALVRRRHERVAQIAAASVLLHALGVALFFAAGRYRLPLLIWLLPLAADQLVWSWRTPHARGRALATTALLALPLNLPNAFTASFAAGPAELGILEAHAFRNQGQSARAEAIATKLVARFPDDANVRVLQSELLLARGRCDLALPQLKRAIELAPRASTPRVMLGSCHDELGDFAAAERAFAGALSVHPFHALALSRAGLLYARHGRPVEARALLNRFVASGYSDDEVTAWLERLARRSTW